MKNRVRSEEYRARRWALKAKRRGRRVNRGAQFEQPAQIPLPRHERRAPLTELFLARKEYDEALALAAANVAVNPSILQEGETRIDMNTMVGSQS